MDNRALLELMLWVCNRYSTDGTELALLPTKMFVLSCKFVDMRALWNQLLGAQAHVHWDLLHTHYAHAASVRPGSARRSAPEAQSNVLGTSQAWLALMALCRWERLAKEEQAIVRGYPILAHLRRHMQECGLDAGGPECYTLVCQTFLLQLVRGLPTLAAVEQLTCNHFRRDTRSACTDLLAKQSEVLFTPEEYLGTLDFVWRHCTVDVKTLRDNLNLLKVSTQEKALCLQMRNMAVLTGRPRLRDRLQTTLQSEDHRTTLDATKSTWETFTGFCHKHQFPPTLNEATKAKLYFLACQTEWSWREHLPAFLLQPGPLLDKVSSHPVTQPDRELLVRVVERMGLHGEPPFEKLTQFRAECFNSFAVVHVQHMTWPLVLQLYVAAYQPRGVWKDVWKHLIGVLSVQIIRDCERFVQANAFQADAVVRLMAMD